MSLNILKESEESKTTFQDLYDFFTFKKINSRDFQVIIKLVIQSQEVTYAELTMPRNKGYTPMRADSRLTDSPINGTTSCCVSASVRYAKIDVSTQPRPQRYLQSEIQGFASCLKIAKSENSQIYFTDHLVLQNLILRQGILLHPQLLPSSLLSLKSRLLCQGNFYIRSY